MGSAVGGIMITKGFAALHPGPQDGLPSRAGQAQSSIVEQMQAAISLPSSITRAWMQLRASRMVSINNQPAGSECNDDVHQRSD